MRIRTIKWQENIYIIYYSFKRLDIIKVPQDIAEASQNILQ